MPVPVTLTAGITISSLAVHANVNGAHPILAGATIAGFTQALCSYVTMGVPTPCVSFVLGPPSETKLQIDGKHAFTAADLAAIALLPSSGNGIPGLVIADPDVLLGTV
jgi:hypothetical protein